MKPDVLSRYKGCWNQAIMLYACMVGYCGSYFYELLYPPVHRARDLSERGSRSVSSPYVTFQACVETGESSLTGPSCLTYGSDNRIRESETWQSASTIKFASGMLMKR
jgi:hypothetical protein